MCGIVGYIGNHSAKNVLMNGLTNLEYRGYDSSGISILKENAIQTLKTKGRVNDLDKLEGFPEFDGTCGIAHTRWATHGEPSDCNAHPHLSNNQLFAVVHNGIIENYQTLKAFLLDKGYHFLSETDTEVIPNLIDYHYQQTHEFLTSVQKTCHELVGSYAICVISPLHPDTLIVAKRNSPLVVGKGNHESFVGSDIPALLAYTKTFYFMENNELAELHKDSIKFYDANLKEIQKKAQTSEMDATAISKNGYEDFMLKEIHEQDSAIRKTLQSCDFAQKLGWDAKKLEKIHQIYLIACGTAMHAGFIGKTQIESLCRIPVTVDMASEFRYRNPIIDEHTLSIFISQSGETADTLAALELAKAKKSYTIAITNVPESSITRLADTVFYTQAGPEIAVASTKAYTSQLALLSAFSIYLAELLHGSTTELSNLKQELKQIPEKVESILSNTAFLKEFAQKIYHEKDLYYIGRGTDYYVALEGALKIKEISYIHAEAYAAGELKHGPIALIEKDTTVVSVVTDPNTAGKSISNMEEVMARGAKILCITNQPLDTAFFPYTISIPHTNPLLAPMLSVIPLQLLAYYVAKEKHLDVDKPRNLAKSVTVE